LGDRNVVLHAAVVVVEGDREVLILGGGEAVAGRVGARGYTSTNMVSDLRF